MNVSPRNSRVILDVSSDRNSAYSVGIRLTKANAITMTTVITSEETMYARVYLYSLRTTTLIFRVLIAKNNPIV